MAKDESPADRKFKWGVIKAIAGMLLLVGYAAAVIATAGAALPAFPVAALGLYVAGSGLTDMHYAVKEMKLENNRANASAA